MALVEAKLIQLLTKDEDGLFVNAETVEIPAQTVLRASVFVTQAKIDETAANYQQTGLLYVDITPEP